MTENNELLKRIQSLERRLKKIEKDAKIGLDDQLFFGVVFSIALFLIALPLKDVAIFYQSVSMLEYEYALKLAEVTKYIGISFLIASSVSRYYGAIKPDKKIRLVSFQLLFMGFDFLLFILVLNTFADIALFNVPLAPFILIIVYSLVAILEKRMTIFYVNRGFIPKRDVGLPLSIAFVILSIAFYVTFMTGILLISLRHYTLSSEVFFLTWIVLFLALSMLVNYYPRMKRKFANLFKRE